MNMHHRMSQRPYLRLFIMAVISFKLMYLFMYAMVNIWGNVFPNYNQFYMAGMMVAPMVVIELILMGSMYENKKWNFSIILASTVFLFLFWMGIRQQIAIGDEQFLKSMIPHHAGAILMCEKASLEDREIRELCQNIISGQQAEIDFMKAKLNSIPK
jgi:uncharacterized protein (DUF305 family)